MNHPVLLVPHQEIYLQSWKNFPEIRWHMLVTGFGGGKTRANVILTLMLVRELQGLKDRAGDYARIICAGYTLSHLSKTFILYLTSYLNSSKTEYRYDTKNNIMYVGTVTIMFLPMDQPDNLFGEDCVACFAEGTGVLTRYEFEGCGYYTTKPIEQMHSGDLVATRQGWKKVLAVHDNGWKDCINVNGVWCTPDHRWASGDTWVRADEITSDTSLHHFSQCTGFQTGSGTGVRSLAAEKRHVYDLTVEDCHEYYVGDDTDVSVGCWLVHNCIQEESDELPEATLIEACKALSERTRQQIIGFRSPFICLGTTSQGESGLYRLYCQFKKKGTGFVLIRGRTQDNFYLPKEQIIDLYKMYDDTERRVFLEGEFLAVSRNRVFPGFDWARNYSDDDFDKYLKPGERVFIGMDFNASYNRASAWVAREGVMHCVKSYDFPDASDSPDVFRYDFPDQDVYWIPDVTTKDSYPQYARALRKNNIHIIHRSKNPLVEDTAFLVSVLCKNSRIVFHKMAREAADSIARAVRDKDGKIGKGKAPSDWQHYADGVRYACSYMALVLPDFRDIRQSLITHIASLRREVEKDETPPVRKLAAGYTQIDPAAFFKK